MRLIGSFEIASFSLCSSHEKHNWRLSAKQLPVALMSPLHWYFVNDSICSHLEENIMTARYNDGPRIGSIWTMKSTAIMPSSCSDPFVSSPFLAFRSEKMAVLRIREKKESFLLCKENQVVNLHNCLFQTCIVLSHISPIGRFHFLKLVPPKVMEVWQVDKIVTKCQRGKFFTCLL